MKATGPICDGIGLAMVCAKSQIFLAEFDRLGHRAQLSLNSADAVRERQEGDQ